MSPRKRNRKRDRDNAIEESLAADTDPVADMMELEADINADPARELEELKSILKEVDKRLTIGYPDGDANNPMIALKDSGEAQLLFVCGNLSGGCGHVGPRNTWDNAFGDGNWQMCPMCREDHAFPVDLQNVHRLAEWGMDPEPVRTLLLAEQARGQDGSCYSDEDDHPRRPLPGESGFLGYLRDEPHPADVLDEEPTDPPSKRDQLDDLNRI